VRLLLGELADVLERKFRLRAADVQDACRLFAETFTLVQQALSMFQSVATVTTMWSLRPHWPEPAMRS
jgi:hypothetical protein